MPDDITDFLAESSMGEDYEPVTFPTAGTSVTGKIVGRPRIAETQYGRRMVIDLDTEGGMRSLWVKPGAMAGALSKALSEAGATTIEAGGTLGMVFVEERDTGKGNPLKIYAAKYVPPAPAVDAASIFDALG